jgi:hypothetical protein
MWITNNIYSHLHFNALIQIFKRRIKHKKAPKEEAFLIQQQELNSFCFAYSFF